MMGTAVQAVFSSVGVFSAGTASRTISQNNAGTWLRRVAEFFSKVNRIKFHNLLSSKGVQSPQC